MKIRTLVMALTMAATMTACGGSSSPTQPTPTPTPAPTPAPTPNPTPNPPTGAQRITIGSNAQSAGNQAFGANPLTIAVGTTVTWVNDDNVPHTATANTGGGFNTGTINANSSASFTFASAGTVPYHCTIHPGMMGTIVVQ